MNVYGRLSELKARAMGVSTTVLDSVLLGYLEDASRRIEGKDICNRHFYSLAGQTRYYDAEPCRELWLRGDDLISITTLKVDLDGDGVFETTLTADTDYWLWPVNRLAYKPYRRIDLNPNSSTLTIWAIGPRRVQIVGTFGYSNETKLVRTSLGDVVQLNGAINDSVTTVTLDADHGVDPGEVLQVDSEQLYVAAVSENTLTVERGVNGTTAASHSDNTDVARRVYPRRVSEVCLELALQAQWGSQRGGAFSEDVGSPTAPMGVQALRNRLGDFINHSGAGR